MILLAVDFTWEVFLRLLVHVLAEDHDAADRRRGVGRNIDQVEAHLKRQVHRLWRIQNSKLFSLGGDHAHLRDLYAVVAAYVRERIVVAAA